MNIFKLPVIFFKYHFLSRPYNYPKEESLFDIKHIGLNLTKFYKSLLCFSKDFDIEKLHIINFNKTKYPIYQVDINRSASKKVFILSGTHGNEQAGILSVLELLKFFKENEDFLDNVSLRIVTPHNPVGAEKFSRFNEKGYDLNRDFKNLNNKINRLILNSLKEFNPDISLSLHEGPQKGTFIIPNRWSDRRLSEYVLNKLSQKKVNLAKRSYFQNRLKPSGYFPAKRFFGFVLQLQSKLLSLEPFGIYNQDLYFPSITLETPWHIKSGERRIEIHTEFIKSIIDFLNRKEY